MLFLEACMDQFGISDNDLFDPTSQYDSTDFGQVLRTLSILSYSATAANSGISGFPSTGQLDVVEENYSILRPLVMLHFARGNDKMTYFSCAVPKIQNNRHIAEKFRAAVYL
jgi:hypothetical protein